MRIRQLCKALILASTLGRMAHAAETPSTLQVKGDSLAYLQNMREVNVKRLQEIDQSLRTKMSADNVDDALIQNLREQRHEHLLRQEFLGRLIFQVDTRYNGGDLRMFLRSSLREMALNDVTANNADELSLWKFMKNAAEALAGTADKREDVLAFLDGYMQRSVTNPANPKLYLSARNYTNGLQNDSGHPMRADLAGAIADKRTREAKVSVDAKVNPKR
jgi:hypothetical protein